MGKCNLNFLLPLVSMSVCCHKDKDTNLWCTFLSWLLKPSYIFFQQRRESLTSHFCLLRKSYFIRVLVVLYIRPVMSYTSQFTTCKSGPAKNCNINQLKVYKTKLYWYIFTTSIFLMARTCVLAECIYNSHYSNGVPAMFISLCCPAER